MLFAVLAIMLFARQPGAIRHPDFCAEDGAVFFKQQYEQGATSVVFKRHGGYLHIAPRLIAATASYFPLRYVPRVYAFVSLALAAASLAFFYSGRFRDVISTDTVRLGVILLMTLMPNSDPLMRLHNLSFYGLWFVVMASLMELPQRFWPRAVLFVLLSLAIWSTPMAVVCLPVIFFRLWQSDGWGERVWWISLAASIVAYAATANLEAIAGAVHQAGTAQSIIHAIGYRVFCYFFLGSTLARPLPTAGWDVVVRFSLLLLLLCVLAVLFVAKHRFRTSQKSWWVSVAVLYFLLALPALFVLRGEWIPDFLGPMGERTWLGHQRYFLCSTFLLCVLAGIAYDTGLRTWLRENIVRGLSGAALLACWISLHLAAFSLWDWHAQPSWKRVAREIEAAEERVKITGGTEVVHIRNSVPVWQFDLVVRNRTRTRIPL